MKPNEAPEKIYIFEEDLQREDHIVMYGINQDKDIKWLVEYTHTDAFIEKAKLWLAEIHRVCDITDEHGYRIELRELRARFENYMKGE